MSSCIQIINTSPDIERIVSSVNYNFTISSQKKSVIAFETITNETANIFLEISSSIQVSNLDIKISIFKRINGNLLSIANINVIDLNTNFQLDTSPGDYFLCFTSLINEYNIKLVAVAAGFVNVFRPSVKIYDGENVARIDPPARVPKPCEEPLIFELISGSLPPGLFLRPNGVIEGVLPDLDCIEETKNDSPSFNWWTTWQGQQIPVDKQWIFTIKATMIRYPEISTSTQLCIRVYNNWSKDRDNFLKQPWLVERYVYPPEPDKIVLPKTECNSCDEVLPKLTVISKSELCYCSPALVELTNESKLPREINDLITQLFVNSPFTTSDLIDIKSIDSVYYDTINEIIKIKSGMQLVTIDVKEKTFVTSIELIADVKLPEVTFEATSKYIDNNTDGSYIIPEIEDTTVILEKSKLINTKKDELKVFCFDGDSVITHINREFEMPEIERYGCFIETEFPVQTLFVHWKLLDRLYYCNKYTHVLQDFIKKNAIDFTMPDFVREYNGDSTSDSVESIMRSLRDEGTFDDI